MHVLFVHQNFPGQYQHVVNALAKSNTIKITSLSIQDCSTGIPANVTSLRYGLNRGNAPNIHPWAIETETKVIRGEACARAAYQLSQKGYKPDLICAHPGWGESLFLREIWPDSPILHYQEFFYKTVDSDLDFDPEFQKKNDWENSSKVVMKNASMLLALEASSWNITPTQFQKSTFPSYWQQSISVIHDGINTQIACPKRVKEELVLSNELHIKQGDPIVTFINRTLEPYRGAHSFIRAIPKILRLHPNAKIVIIGNTKGVSYGRACDNGEWKEQFFGEIEGKYNPQQVYFAGELSYINYIKLMQMSQAHVYLTYPFVLSWSLMEAMSIGCAIVGSSTAPVKELIQDGHNGLLVDFFDYEAIATNVVRLLNDRDLADTLGNNARTTILKDYSLEECLPRQVALMNMVACGALDRYK